VSRSKVFTLLALSTSLHAATILSEEFDDVTTLPGAGWVQTNNSTAGGLTSWFQGNFAIFPSNQNGSDDHYIAANFDNAPFGGNISNWLITPTLVLNNGDVVTFYTRTETNPLGPDSLELRFSDQGASTFVGATDSSVGDFSQTLIPVNSPPGPGGYPQTWTLQTFTFSTLAGPTSGRLAFRYVVSDTSVNGDYIGIDSVTIASPGEVPEPATAGLILLGLSGILGSRKVRHMIMAIGPQQRKESHHEL